MPIPDANTADAMPVEPQQTIIQTEQGTVVITTQEGESIKAALLDRLRASSLEDREHLLRMTEKVNPRVDPDGFLRIGAWLLQGSGKALSLNYRLQIGPSTARQIVATVAKGASGWTVTDLREERIAPRR